MVLQGLELCRYNLFIQFQCICANYGFTKQRTEFMFGSALYARAFVSGVKVDHCLLAVFLLNSFEFVPYRATSLVWRANVMAASEMPT